MGLFENLFVDIAIHSILIKIQAIWFWAIIAGAILAAFFLIITLVQIEARTKAKSRWLALTLCSFAVVAGLIMLKPKPNTEPVQYMPAPPPVSENVDKLKEGAGKKNTTKSASSAGGTTGVEKSQGATGNQGVQGQAKGSTDKQGASKEVPSLQDQLNKSLQKKSNSDGKVDYSDPVLEQILEQKRQAEENSKETTSSEPSAQEFSDAGSFNDLNQQKMNSDSREQAAQQRTDLYSESQRDNQITNKGDQKELEQQMQDQKMVKARVLTSFLNVRDKGSLDGLIIGSLNKDDIVEVVDQPETGEWVNIKLNSGQKGWVMKKYLKILS